MTANASDRHVWAVETLDVQPTDRLLEIGCGHGVTVSLVCERLIDGTILAIDRSRAMVDAAVRRNDEHVASGKAAFETVALEEADLSGREFDKVFAFHVGLFWKEPATALDLVKPLLAARGALYLFQQPFRRTEVDVLSERWVVSLRDGGFGSVHVVVGEQEPVPAFCVVGRTERTRKSSRM